MSAAVSLVGFPTILIGHKEMKPEVVYILTKTLVENKSELIKTHAGFKDFLPEESWQFEKFSIPLHPGAEKYYRQKG
jgi:uncharacterized protein